MFCYRFRKYIAACCSIYLLSCSATKFVPDGQYLLDKVVVVTDTSDVKPSEMKPYLQQQPNFKVFGVFRWSLYLYNLSGRNANNRINKLIRSMGEPPVLLDVEQARQSQIQLQRYLSNRGYMNATVDMRIDTIAGKKRAKMHFRAETNTPYRIRRFQSTVTDPVIDSVLHLKPRPAAFPASLFRTQPRDFVSFIREGMMFDRNLLDRERQRLTTLLRRNGYYAFNRDYIGFNADTSLMHGLVDIELYIKPLETAATEGAVVESPHRRYYINKVSIMTDYDPLEVSAVGDNYRITDSVTCRGVNIYYGVGGQSIRASALQQSCYIMPGTLFNERSVEQTYSSFSSLNAVRYTSIKFTEVRKGDSTALDCTVLTAPAKRHGVRFDVEGTNSAGDMGFASSMTYQHRNLFKGSELFSAKIHGGYEYLSSTNERGNYWEFSGETSLLFPHFMFPFVSYDFRRRIRATTEFNLSYDQQRRPEYFRSIVSGGWIYHWQNRMNTLARHTFRLLDVNYVFLPFIEREFKERLPETTALYNYSDRFVVSSGYVYTFNNYDPLERRRNNYSFRVAIETAGDLLYALSNLTGAEKDVNGRFRLFGINYSEFMKLDLDFSRSLMLDTRNSFAFHIGTGIAYPYGNSREIPFERRYYAGGANSNRGWSVRSLGPGRMALTDSTSFAQQTGDIRLDASLEYRSRVFWKLELALFLDAGNIWTIYDYDYQKNGVFDFRTFYKEIAVSYGLGVRLDFDYFLVRLDAGLKAYNPQADNNNRWALYKPNFKDNFALHFAVGYPF